MVIDQYSRVAWGGRKSRGKIALGDLGWERAGSRVLPTRLRPYIYIYIYIYIIVGNCTKCCRKVLNTRECRAKHNSK